MGTAGVLNEVRHTVKFGKLCLVKSWWRLSGFRGIDAFVCRLCSSEARGEASNVGLVGRLHCKFTNAVT